jgi:hypothetical protein
MWVSEGQIRLDETHPKNIEAAREASAYSDSGDPMAGRSWDIFDGLRKYGPPASSGARSARPRVITDEKAASYVRQQDRGEGVWQAPRAPQSGRLASSKATMRDTHPTGKRRYNERGSKIDMGELKKRITALLAGVKGEATDDLINRGAKEIGVTPDYIRYAIGGLRKSGKLPPD